MLVFFFVFWDVICSLEMEKMKGKEKTSRYKFKLLYCDHPQMKMWSWWWYQWCLTKVNMVFVGLWLASPWIFFFIDILVTRVIIRVLSFSSQLPLPTHSSYSYHINWLTDFESAICTKMFLKAFFFCWYIIYNLL